MDKNLSPDLILEEVFSIWHATRGAYLISGKPYVLALTYDAKRAGFAAAFNHPKLAEYRPLIEARSIDDAFEDLAQTFQMSKDLDIAFSSCAYHFYLQTFPLTALTVALSFLWEPGFLALRTLFPLCFDRDPVCIVYITGSVYFMWSACWLWCIDKFYKDQVDHGQFTGDEATPLMAIARVLRIWRRWPGWKRKAALRRYSWRWVVMLVAMTAFGAILLHILIPFYFTTMPGEKRPLLESVKWNWYVSRIIPSLSVLGRVCSHKKKLADRKRAVA